MSSLPDQSAAKTLATFPLLCVPDSNEELTSELTRLAGHINAAEYRFLKLLAALIERDAWGENGGMKTPAHWLNYYCGIDLGAAREKVRVAKALARLPKIDQSFATGVLSYSKVRAMTRCATEGLIKEKNFLRVGKLRVSTLESGRSPIPRKPTRTFPAIPALREYK